LPLEITTLAEEMNAHGYRTYAVQTNTFIQARHNFSQGFDEYIESSHPKCTADKVADFAMEFFSQIKRKPAIFFMYLHFMDTHYPYAAPEPYQEKFTDKDYARNLDLTEGLLRDLRNRNMNLSEQDKDHIRSLYDAEIRFVDDQVQRIMEQLERLDLSQSTILIICLPESSAGNKRITQLARLIDIYPTVLGILGLDTEQELMGSDLSESLFSDEALDLDLLGFSEAILYGAEQKAIQSERYKFIKRTQTHTFEFYDLENDRLEKYNLRAKQNDFKKLFNEFRNAKSRSYRREQKELDDKTKKILKSLGYIK